MTQARRLFQGAFVVLSALSLGSLPAAAQEIQWRHDVNAARREAKETNRPLLIDFGTASCYWCKVLDSSTFRDPSVAQLLNERYIPLKVDAEREAGFAQSLNIHSYPTLVFMSPEGKVLGRQDGFVEAGRLRPLLQRFMGDPGVAKQPPPRSPVETPVPTVSQETPERIALPSYAEMSSPSSITRPAVTQVSGDPDSLQRVCDDLSQRLGESYLALAEVYLRQGQADQAASYLERIVQACPGTRPAQVAQAQLLAIRTTPVKPADPSIKVRAQSR